MAIVEGPALSLQASGNLGALCFSRWRSLQIARDIWTGTYPNTSKQQAVNAIMTEVSQAWGGSLIGEEREMWEGKAKTEVWKNRFGRDYVPTGYQFFCRINLQSKLISVTNPIQKVPPMMPAPVLVTRCYSIMHPTLDRVVVYFNAGTGVPVEADGWMLYRAGPYNSGGRRALEGEYRFRAKRGYPGWYYTDYVFVDTKWYWYKCRWYFENGFVGNWWYTQVQAVFH